MKTIELSDKDYDSLMELTKELQTQENDGQAHPYFWEPMSGRYEQDPNEDGELMFVFDSSSYTPEELWDDAGFDSMKKTFIAENELAIDVAYGEILDDWIDFIESDTDFTKWYRVLKEKSEHNPSLFKSDVKGFIESNKHHLGQMPHTYARTIWRMPKMITLVSILCRINKQENADNEIKRYCHT